MYICSDAYVHRQTVSSLVQVMNCQLFSAKPVSEPMLTLDWQDPTEESFSEILISIQQI